MDVTTGLASSHARETRACSTYTPWRSCHYAEDLPGTFLVHNGEIKFAAPRVGRLLVGPAEFARKQPARQRTPNEQANLLGFQKGNDLPFEFAAGDRVIGLEGVETGKVLEFGNTCRDFATSSMPAVFEQPI